MRSVFPVLVGVDLADGTLMLLQLGGEEVGEREGGIAVHTNDKRRT
jgi:hypothetical protein